MSVKTFEKLTALLDKHQARYRVVEPPPTMAQASSLYTDNKT